MKIEQLQDYPAIRQIADALWRQRASVLVGAGFSRNAQLAAFDAPLPPLWNGLTLEMGLQLYTADPAQAPTDALRLAEEYRRFYGQAALDDFVSTHIRDASWSPGTAHKLLLELPWSDVLTTNYDTLLERAALEINERDYELVRLASDFAHARAPRIVKLHGTIGVSEHFIVAEEDYRTYPTTHAAFVNFARQSFLENELCLLGFSGGDANFLQWSGWVRDHLGSSSRRIYLVGLLELSAASRKYLEARNIAPIDLSDLVSGIDNADKQSSATLQFLEHLHAARPKPLYSWKPADSSSAGITSDDLKRRQQDSAYAAELYRDTLKVWSNDRIDYPGWLICPPSLRHRFAHQVRSAPWPNATTLGGLKESERASVLYEMLWRMRTGLFPLEPAFCELIEPYGDLESPCGLSKAEQLEIASALAAQARSRADEAEFLRWATIIEKHAPADTDARAGLHYQRALWARDRRDLASVEKLIPDIVGPDPIWGLRRAAMLCELGQSERAQLVVTEALADLRRRQRQDRSSLWIASRRAWAEWLARLLKGNRDFQLDPWKEQFRELKCDPWQLIEHVEEELREAVEKQRGDAVQITPLFEPGHYKDAANTVHFGESVSSPETEFQRLVEDAGIPLRLEYVNVLGGCVRSLAELAAPADLAGWLRLIRLIGSHSDPIIERIFGRAAIAAIPEVDRTAIIGALKNEICFWRPKLQSDNKWNLYAVERLRLVLELLARFAACEASDKAKQTHTFALDFASNPPSLHFRLFEPLGRLLEFSVLAIAPAERTEMVLRDLEFPTQGEAGHGQLPHWPCPSSWLGYSRAIRPMDDPCWAARIARLIELAQVGSQDRTEAVCRLAYLVRFNLLTDTERASFAKALWSELDQGDPPLPVVQGLYLSSFLWLPTPPGVDIEAKLRNRIYNIDPKAIDANLLKALVDLGKPGMAGRFMHADEDAAVRLFDQLIIWRRATFNHPFEEAFEGPNQARTATALAQALGEEIVPALTVENRTKERLSALLQFSDDLAEPLALVGLPSFARALPTERDHIIERIKRIILANNSKEVNAGVMTVFAWLKDAPADVPNALIERIIAAFEIHRWPSLLGILTCLNKLVLAKRVPDEWMKRLDAPLGELIDETAYERIDAAGHEAVTFSLVRQECVRLAAALDDAGATGPNASKWLELSVNDPLPEVRYAVERSACIVAVAQTELSSVG